MKNLDKRTTHIFFEHNYSESLDHLISNPKRYRNLKVEFLLYQINIVLADTNRLFILFYLDKLSDWENAKSEVENIIHRINRINTIDELLAEL
jgi:hypothetical protein